MTKPSDEKLRRSVLLASAGAVAILCCALLLWLPGQGEQGSERAAEVALVRPAAAEELQPTRDNGTSLLAPDIDVPKQKSTHQQELEQIKAETFWESLARACNYNEVRKAPEGGFRHIYGHDWNTLEKMTKTPLFAKMHADLRRARNEGMIEALIWDMRDSSSDYLEKMAVTEKELLLLIEANPQFFQTEGELTQEAYDKLTPLIRSNSVKLQKSPDGLLLLDIISAQRGLRWNSIFLGLTENPKAMAPLLNIAHADRERKRMIAENDTLTRYEAAMQAKIIVNNDLSAGSCWALADAFDRVLVASAEMDSLPSAAAEVAAAYIEWRKERQPTPRQSEYLDDWGYPQTTAEQQAAEEAAEARTVLLNTSWFHEFPVDSIKWFPPGTIKIRNLSFLRPAMDNDSSGLTLADCATIQQFAENFQAAYQNSP